MATIHAPAGESEPSRDDLAAPLAPERAAALRAVGEAHLWPGPYKPADLSSAHGLKLVVGGAGPWVLDAEGRTWFDSLSGMWLTNVGHGRREIADAVHAQMSRMSYAPDGTVNPATIELADRVAALAPDPGSRVLFTSGGSEAVETALKMARKYHRNRGESGRFKVISRRGSYHGATLACLSLGGGGSNTGVEYGPLLPGAIRVQGPDEYRPILSDLECAFEIERAILNEGPETVAAVIGEPISAAAGVHTPNGATIATPKVAETFTGEYSAFNHRFTFGGNPAACAAGLATLDIIEREGLVENARVMGDYLYERAQELYRHPIVGDVRGGRGLMCAVELVRDRATREPFPSGAGLKAAAHEQMDEHGILGRGGDIFPLAPSLCVTYAEIDDLMTRLDAVFSGLDRRLRYAR